MAATLNLRRLLSALVVVGLGLLPVYLWSSGGAQLAHVILFAAAVAVFVMRGVRLDQIAVVLGALAIYVAIRDSFFAFRHTSVESVVPILYAAFSWWIYVAFRAWFSDERNLPAAVRGVLLGLIVAVAGVLLMGYGATVDEEGGRSVGTFNNPNQLGYFSVCVLSVSGLFYLRRLIALPLLVIFVGGALFLAVASLSKAAMIASGVGVLSIGFLISQSRLKFLLGIVIAAIATTVVVMLVQSGALDDYRFFARLSSIGQQADDSLAGRGYGVLLEAGPLDFLFGFGAQEVRSMLGHELHSTIAAMFANYGVVGGLMFIGVLFLWAKRTLLEFGVPGLLVVVAPPMLYGITHNGSRFTIFWLLVSLSMVSVAGMNASRGRDAGASERNRQEVMTS